MLTDQLVLDLNSKLVIIRMLCQADLSSASNVFEVTLEGVINFFDCALEVWIPLILQQRNTLSQDGALANRMAWLAQQI